MHRFDVHHVVAVLGLLCLAGCGGDSPSGGPGPGPSPTPTGITIAPGTTFLRVNQTETFTATMTMSNGSTQPVQPSWQSDNTSVLTFEGTGTARGRSNGTATIIASSQGLSSTRLIRVTPDFQGTWTGDYQISRCDATKEYQEIDFCHAEDGFAPGRIFPVAFRFTHERDSVSGAVTLGQIEGTANGAIDANGQFAGSGNVPFTAEGVTGLFAMAPLNLTAQGDRLQGRFTITVTFPGVPGQGVFDADLRTVTRTAASSPTLSLGPHIFGSLREAWQAARQH
jgi:hypothetical protein